MAAEPFGRLVRVIGWRRGVTGAAAQLLVVSHHIMKALIILSLTCAVMSLLAVFGFSAMTVVPSSGAESGRLHMTAVAAAFVAVWLGLAFWVRARQRAGLQFIPPQWLRRLLVCVSVVYLFGVFFLVIG